MQSEIAGSVAKELKIALLGNNQTTIGTAPSNESLDAYNAFLQGNFYAARHSAEDFRKAIGYYEKAVQLDPNYALAYASLSNIASNLVYNFSSPTTQEGKETVARAREAADTALRLAKALGTTPEFWLNLQARYAVEVTKPKIKRDLETIETAPAVVAA